MICLNIGKKMDDLKNHIIDRKNKGRPYDNFTQVRNVSVPIMQIPFELNSLVVFLDSYKIINYLEIGSCFGGSFFEIGKRVQSIEKMVSIDLPWMYCAKKCLDMVAYELSSYDKNVVLIEGDSQNQQNISQAKNHTQYYDFIFVDGNHTYDGVKRDYENYFGMCKMMGFHDINPSSKSNLQVDCLWKELIDRHNHIVINSKQTYGGIGIIFND